MRDGTLVPGDRVPSEPELAREYGVARETGARALRLLKDEGLITRRRGIGSVVATTPGHKTVEIPPGCTVTARMPTTDERARLGAAAFSPVLVVAGPGGDTALYDADAVVLATTT
jgi:DNA-binding transcriptional MocR family regulator